MKGAFGYSTTMEEAKKGVNKSRIWKRSIAEDKLRKKDVLGAWRKDISGNHQTNL